MSEVSWLIKKLKEKGHKDILDNKLVVGRTYILENRYSYYDADDWDSGLKEQVDIEYYVCVDDKFENKYTTLWKFSEQKLSQGEEIKSAGKLKELSDGSKYFSSYCCPTCGEGHVSNEGIPVTKRINGIKHICVDVNGEYIEKPYGGKYFLGFGEMEYNPYYSYEFGVTGYDWEEFYRCKKCKTVYCFSNSSC